MKKIEVNEIDLGSVNEDQEETAKAMQESDENIKIQPTDLDTLIGFIHKGLSLQEITEELNRKFNKPKRGRKKVTEEEQTQKQVTKLLQPIINPPYTVSVGVRYALDQKRVLEISATEPLENRSLMTAQEEIYEKILESLSNLISKS